MMKSTTTSPRDWAKQSNLTTAQKQLWLGQKLSPDTPLYNMAFLFTFSGRLETTHFRAAFGALARRCDALRTVIEECNGIPSQRVLPEIEYYELPVLDFQHESDAQSAAQRWATTQAKQQFTCSERLFDTALIQCSEQCTVWYLNQHHLITDMVSLKRLYEVMGELYERSLAGTLENAPQLPAYADVVLPSPAQRAIDYWQQQQVSPVSLYHRAASTVTSSASRRVSFSLSAEQTKALKKLALDSPAAALTLPISLFNMLAGLVFAYLHRISGQSQVALTAPAQGRPSADLKQTIGVFIELFPLSANIEPGETFTSLLAKVSEASGQWLRYAQPGASEYVSHQASNVVLNFLTIKIPLFAGLPCRTQWLHAGASDPQHHLRILVHDFDGEGRLQLHFDFNSELFDDALQDRAAAHFSALVAGAIANPNQPISNIPLVSATESDRLRSLSRSTPITITQTVVQQFESQVEKSPNAIALTCQSSGRSLTYSQLNAKANQLAHLLQQRGIQAESPVALSLTRSVEMLIAIWGVLKVGGTYVPLDPNYPDARRAHILSETQPHWVLTHAEWDALDLDAQPDHNLETNIALSQRAYCLYTSGSTGTPKGVEIEHHSLANYAQWAQQQYVQNGSLAFPLFTPLTFDLTVTSIYVPLISGGQVVIYPESKDTIDLSLQRVFQDNVVDVIKLTPSHLALVKDLPPGNRVKVLILGGENLKTALAREIVSETNVALYNEYGPTEATVGCMVERFDTEAEASSISVPIGAPAVNAAIYLFDDYQNLAPLGDVGEIYIGGAGLARGYLNRPELTAERFVMWEGQRLYRTGDLGRWERDGKLAYLGRCDRQTKINGIRVELGDIEAAIATHPQVNRCIVKTHTNPKGRTQLAAYYTCHQPISVTDLRTAVSQQLPNNLTPTYFIPLSELPLTVNGKVDIDALPVPTVDQHSEQVEFVPPRSATEKTLADVWQQVLNVSNIGIYDDFFELGGDSISAIQIAARLSELYSCVSPNTVFQKSTIAALSAVIKDAPVEAVKTTTLEDFSLAQVSSSQLDKLSALLDKADQAGGAL